MQRRLDLAMTLVGDPRIIFLDEPTAGLDPRSRRTMWAVIRELVDGGVTILLTTQYLEEADRLADRIAVLDQGRLVAEGSRPSSSDSCPAATSASSSPTAPGWSGRSAPSRGRLATRSRSPSGSRATAGSGRCAACSTPSTAASIEVDALAIRTPDLDDVFLSLTGHAEARKERPMTAAPAPLTTRHDAAAQPAPHAALSVADLLHRRDPSGVAAAVRVRASAARSAPGSAARPVAAMRISPTWSRASL